MPFYHLRLLIEKSARYAWRQRICRYIPKIFFEFFIPVISILLLCLFRWMYSPSTKNNTSLIISAKESISILNYTSVYRCSSASIPVEITSNKTYQHFKTICPRSQFIFLSELEPFNENLRIQSNNAVSYHCQYSNQKWCSNQSSIRDSFDIQHPSSYSCPQIIDRQFHTLFKAYLAIESLLYRPIQKQYLSIFTWPCSSYLSDPMFEIFPQFSLIILLILVDACILFNYNLLFHELIKEKQQNITELLRLLSIHPIFNTFSWFLRHFLLQIISNLFLIIILKISFQGGIYFPYISIWFLVFTFFFWTIQVLSQSIFIAHLFNNLLKASLCSWLIYFLSFWLAVSSSIRIPFVIHLILSICLPFYSIKRLFILFIQINTNLGRGKEFIFELIFIWLTMFLGSILMCILTFYLEQIRPGKIRSWLWPLGYLRNRRKNPKKHPIEPLINDQITVRVENLTKTFGRTSFDRQIVLDQISFELKSSTIYGLIGPNGAGKTTTMEILCGLLSYDCGTIELHPKSIGYCPQEDILFWYLTVQEQLEFYASVRSNGKNVDKNQIENLLIMMDMFKYRDRLCWTLSGGMKRKISILCAFIGDVDVIILDEPSSSLDPVARRTLWTWLRESKINRTLLISSHLLDEVEELCDTIFILDSGKIRAQGTILELKHQYNPLGDRLYLQTIPSYVPIEWIIDEKNHLIQLQNRKQLISLLEKLENEQISYSLKTITLDEIFLQLTSHIDSTLQDENKNQSQIEQLFSIRTNNHRWWSQQILAVLIRRCQLLLRQARLLPIVILLYLIYALSPLYLPSIGPPSIQKTRYLISSSSEIIEKMNLKNFDTKILPSSEDFQQYLIDHQKQNEFIAIRIPSSTHFECYLSSPTFFNLISSCLPIFTLFSNRTLSELQLINHQQSPISFTSTPIPQDNSIFCFSILPSNYHFSILSIFLIFLISAAIVIQDYTSGLHTYSLIHGLSSFIHWSITFLSDLILCLFWLLILVLIVRFVHPTTFTSLFFLLTPLYFIVDLPFIYLLGKSFQSPILGSTVILLLLQFAYVFNQFQVFFEIFRSSSLWSKLLPFIRWILLLAFPNVNVFILIKAILRKSLCPYDRSIFPEEFTFERYENKILIHSLIFIGQFLIYFGLLILIDNWKWKFFSKKTSKEQNQVVDDDVENERQRIETMTDEDRADQAIILKDLSKVFHGSNQPAVDRLTFAVSHRECFGLLGFNGSGKTTTFRMLVGDLQPTNGLIIRKSNETIGYCPQNDISFSGLTVLQSINYICRLHGLEPASINQLILTQFHLEKYQSYLVSNLSGGTRRRLHLALCLIGSPSLLLLDEPTAKVDPFLRHHIRLILQHRPIDTSIIFASHSMFECEQLCDRLTILVRGMARCLGTLEQLKMKYGRTYRIRLRFRHSETPIPSLIHVENSDEYLYQQESLAQLFSLLEQLVENDVIVSDYTVQLTSLEHVFLTLQHSLDSKS